MDDPVTDIAFVSNKDKCPTGYTLVEATPCGHEAQLWEKVLGGEDGERFLCFTKEDKDGMVIEDIYVPGRSDQYLYKGYKIVKKTVEGDEPMRHRQLAVRKVRYSEAKKVVADVIVCKSKDEISQMYKKTGKSVNNLTICFRLVDYKPKPKESTGGARRSSDPAIESIKESEMGRRRATSTSPEYIDGRMEGLSVSGQTSRRAARVPVSELAHTAGYTATPPSQPMNEPVQVHYTPSLGSAKPSYTPSEPPASYNHTHTDPHHPEPPTTSYPAPTTSYPATTYPAPTTSYPAPTTSYPAPTTTYPAPTTTYPAPTTSYPAPTTSYLAPTTSYPAPATTYPAPTTSSYQPAGSYPPSYPQPAVYPSYPPNPVPGYYPSYQPSGPPRQPSPRAPTGYNTGIGFGGPSYPPPPSVGYPGYTSVAGTGFVAAPPSGPAPYNPYHHGPAPYNPYHHGPTPYPPTAAQPSGQNYGWL